MAFDQRIAVFSLAYAPFEGGAEAAAREIMTRLPNRRFAVLTHRFDAGWPEREEYGNVSVTRLGNIKNQKSKIKTTNQREKNYYGNSFEKFLYIFRAWRAAEQLHRKEPFQMIWAVMAAYAGTAALFFKLRHPRVPFLLTIQEGDSEKHILGRVGIFYIFWRLIFKKADYIQAISSYLADFAKRHGARAPIEVVPNGVDLEKFKVTSNKRQGQSEKVVITASRLVHKNGIDILLRAFAKLTADKPKRITYTLIILGSGPEEKILRRLARDLNIEEHVQFLGQVPPEEVGQHLSRADLFVRPSRSEGLGSAFLEAMAAGLPIIGTAVGGIPDFLKDPSTSSGQVAPTGLFARVDDPDDLHRKIQLLFKDRSLRERLRRNGKRLIESRYEWKEIARAMDSIFNRIEVPIRLCVATGIFPPDIGGPATYSRFLKENASALGCEVVVVTYQTISITRSPGVLAVSRKWPKGLRHFIFGFRVLLHGSRADVILAADASPGAGAPAAIAARLLGKPLVIRVTGDYAWEQGVQRFGIPDTIDEFQKKKYSFAVERMRSLQTSAVRRARLVIVPSEYLKRMVMDWGVPESKIRVIWNAVEALPPISKTDARRLLALEPKAKIAVSVGRLVPWKGFSELIAAVPNLAKKFSHFKLLIIGDGPLGTALDLAIRSKGLESGVKVIGAVPRDRLQYYLRAADVFVLNTGYEGFSHQVIEAVAAGLPVITTDVGGNPEIAKELPGSMILVPHGNLTALEAELERALRGGGENRQRLRNQKLVGERFSVERMLGAHRELIQALMK